MRSARQDVTGWLTAAIAVSCGVGGCARIEGILPPSLRGRAPAVLCQKSNPEQPVPDESYVMQLAQRIPAEGRALELVWKEGRIADSYRGAKHLRLSLDQWDKRTADAVKCDGSPTEFPAFETVRATVTRVEAVVDAECPANDEAVYEVKRRDGDPVFDVEQSAVLQRGEPPVNVRVVQVRMAGTVIPLGEAVEGCLTCGGVSRNAAVHDLPGGSPARPDLLHIEWEGGGAGARGRAETSYRVVLAADPNQVLLRGRFTPHNRIGWTGPVYADTMAFCYRDGVLTAVERRRAYDFDAARSGRDAYIPVATTTIRRRFEVSQDSLSHLGTVVEHWVAPAQVVARYEERQEFPDVGDDVLATEEELRGRYRLRPAWKLPDEAPDGGVKYEVPAEESLGTFPLVETDGSGSPPALDLLDVALARRTEEARRRAAAEHRRAVEEARTYERMQFLSLLDHFHESCRRDCGKLSDPIYPAGAYANCLARCAALVAGAFGL